MTVLGAALLFAACASTGRRNETVATPRLKDSAPERSASLRAGAPGLGLEAEEQRWGIEAAKQRKRDRPRQPPPDQPLPVTVQTGLEIKGEAPREKP